MISIKVLNYESLYAKVFKDNEGKDYGLKMKPC